MQDPIMYQEQDNYYKHKDKQNTEQDLINYSKSKINISFKMKNFIKKCIIIWLVNY